MKYKPPYRGPYESKLTAESMSRIMGNLLSRYIKREDILTLAKDSVKSLTKLWEKPEIRSRLEEYIQSYMFNGLEPQHYRQSFHSRVFDYFRTKTDGKPRDPASDIKSIVAGKNVGDNIKKHISSLEKEHGTVQKAIEFVAPPLQELYRRAMHLEKEVRRIPELKEKRLTINNANDGFTQIMTSYKSGIDMAMYTLKKIGPSQS